LGAVAWIAALGSLLAGCSLPKVPDGVSWDTEITLPIAAHTYALWEVAESDSVLTAEGSGIGMTLPDSALFFSYTRDIEPVRPGDWLKLDSMDYTVEKRMDNLRLTLDLSQIQSTTLGTINPALANRHGMVASIPPFSFHVILEAPLGQDFSRACVDSGHLSVHLQSTLPFHFDDVQVSWTAEREQAIPIFGGALDAEADTSCVRSLEDHCLSEMMYLDISGTAPGGESVLIDSTQGFQVTLNVNEITVDVFEGRLPRQSWTVDSLHHLEQQHELYEAVVASGDLTVEVSNLSPFADSVRLVLDDVRSAEGSELVVACHLSPQEARELNLNLAGYRLIPSDPAGQRIHSRLETVIEATEEPVLFEPNEDRVITRFRTSELRFTHFEGVLHELETAIDRDSTEVEQPPEGWENVHPANLDLRLTLHSATTMQSRLDLNLFSQRAGQILGTVNRTADLLLGEDSTLWFTGLAALVPQLPEWIGYDGTVLLNGAVSVDDTASIRGQVVLSAPLTFTLDRTHIPGDVQKVEPDAMDEIQEIVLNVKLWNALPISGILRLIAARDSEAVLENSGLPSDTLIATGLPPAVIVEGRVRAAGYGELEVSPPPGFYDLLRHPPFFVRPELFIAGTNGDTLTAYGSDYVRFSATARVRYRISWEG
jgi:hypothetical protein